MSETTKPRFDPTINLGHIITFIGFLVTIFVGWTNLDKRVVVLEESRNTQLIRDKHQDALLIQQTVQADKVVAEIKAAIIRIEQKLDDMNRAQR